MMYERNRYFSFTVDWYGNVKNEYLTNLIRKEVQKTIDKIAKEHNKVHEISKVSVVQSTKGWK